MLKNTRIQTEWQELTPTTFSMVGGGYKRSLLKRFAPISLRYRVDIVMATHGTRAPNKNAGTYILMLMLQSDLSLAHTKRRDAMRLSATGQLQWIAWCVIDTLATRCDCRRRSPTHRKWDLHVQSRRVAFAVNRSVRAILRRAMTHCNFVIILKFIRDCRVAEHGPRTPSRLYLF